MTIGNVNIPTRKEETAGADSRRHFICKVYVFVHGGLGIEPRDPEQWRNQAIEPTATVEVACREPKTAAAYAYVKGHGLRSALLLQDLNAPECVVRSESDLSSVVGGLKQDTSPVGDCWLADWNPFAVTYITVK